MRAKQTITVATAPGSRHCPALFDAGCQWLSPRGAEPQVFFVHTRGLPVKLFVYALTLTIIISLLAVAQNSAARPGGPQSTPPPGNTPQEPQSNPAGPTKDRIASGDQAAKASEPKGRSTLIGCLSGPDSDGKYTLRSMSHRTGVQVLGSDDLKADSGSKVKLTGSWVPGDEPAESTKGKESRKFQATDIEVLAQKCEAPSEKTPLSKQKQQKPQQKQKSSASGNEDATSPK